MTVKHQSSTVVANADAVPAVVNNVGAGAAGNLREVTGSVVLTASQDADSTVRFVRVPTNAKIKQVRLDNQAQTDGDMAFGVYYPTTGPTAKADLAANAINVDFFADAVALDSIIQPTDITNQNAENTIDLWNQPLWQALGLASDPGGYFDIVGTVTGAITTGTGIVGISVAYVE